MRIEEIFYSIQGEGLHQGLPMVFVRLAGCNLKPSCSYCDTPYAQSPLGGEAWTVWEVIKEIVRLAPTVEWVCITGGEPLLQEEELGRLVEGLKEKEYNYKIEIETNGSYHSPEWAFLVDSWCIDIKCPSSGVCGKSLESWFASRPQDQIKLVVGTREDLDFTREVLARHRSIRLLVLVSPVLTSDWAYGENPWLQEVAEFCLEEKVRFSLQIHKVVWGFKRRGV